MNTKMKVLSLAMVGAFGYVGVASAACPNGPTVAEGGAWAGKTQTNGTVAIATPGYDGTECRMTSSLAAGASAFAAATVRDDSPSNEARYRAQFTVNADDFSTMGAFESAQIFSAQAAASHANSPFLVRFSVSGGTNKVLNVIAANENGGTNVSTTSVPLAAGNNRIEFDLTVGASGSLKIWNNACTEGSPTNTVSNLNNTGWTGVDRANLGVASANNLFRANQAGKVMSFDQFDSRRSTFIGCP